MLLDELLQGALPHRVFEWSDVMLNWLGTGLGFTGWWVGNGWATADQMRRERSVRGKHADDV